MDARHGMDAEPKQGGGKETLLTIQEFACWAGTPPRLIERLVRLEIIEPARRDPELFFEPGLVERVQKALRMRTELGVSWTSMPLVLELMERIDRLHDELNRLKARGEPPPEV